MPNVFDMLCPECGSIYPYFLNGDFPQKILETKSIYCYKCIKPTNHIYIKDKDYMLIKLETKLKRGHNLNEYEQFVYDLLSKQETLKTLRKQR